FRFQLKTGGTGNETAGRVIQGGRGIYLIQTGLEQFQWGDLSGRFYFEVSGSQDFPTVGDWVVYSAIENSGRVLIQRVLTRQSYLQRKVAGVGVESQALGANIDTVFVLSSANAEFNLRRLERYFVLCRESSVKFVLVLTKTDLATEDEIGEIKNFVQKEYPEVPIVEVSVLTNVGLNELQIYFKSGETVCLLGSSGVGKSSLVNHLLERSALKTQSVRESDAKGRHTTSERHMFLLPEGGVIIDTPGMRELQLSDHGGGLSSTFDDVESLSLKCRFSNCTHSVEPGCMIQQCIRDGSLSSGRWASYQKMLREVAYQKQRVSKSLAHKERRNFKANKKRFQDYS
ncbi:MAG: ribosome small subunit-dependent GTPase A, partial [Proteobacteria bacterium]|nr:ribosome small subunit-dependent GTPase A [Pseudomonadota bacterium]